MKKLVICLGFVSVLLTGCGSLTLKGDNYALNQEWSKAVIEYRLKLKENPGNIELKSRLKQAELQAAEFYYQRGLKRLNEDNLDAAIVEFQQGIIAMPDHTKLQQVMQVALNRKESNDLYLEAVRNHELNKNNDAIAILKRALQAYPENIQAKQLLMKISKENLKENGDELALNSKEPITLNFNQTNLKTAFGFITKSFGINVVFDEGIQSVPVTLYARNVTFEQALNLILRTTQTFYKKIGSNTILVAPDTKDKHGQYEDHIIRTYNLKSIPAKTMSGILKNMLGIKKIVINEELNSLIIRDTEEILQLSQKLIENNDRKSAEMILDVEILEVNRTKVEQLGLNFGSVITASYDPFVGSFRKGISHGTVTVPNITFNYFKQDVDAKTLANPKIRVLDNKKAKIHIGDRVPLRSATIQDATGQTRTTFEYRDIGIRLQVQPEIHLDNSVTVELNLEVSTLGQNLGTAEEPAYSIGTRNADSFMMLKDGETAILGGLIRDEDRRSRILVPGLGDIPIIGSLFTTYDDNVTRTDVLLTITPRIVRTWDLADKANDKIFSGTENQYSTKPMFAFLDQSAGSGPAQIVDASMHDESSAINSTGATSAAPGSQIQGNLSFDKPIYSIEKGQQVTVDIIAENISDASELPLELMFNPNLIEYIDTEPMDIGDGDVRAIYNPEKGVVQLRFNELKRNPDSTKPIARLVFNARDRGVSYLVYKSVNYTSSSGEPLKANIRASRIVIK